VKFEIVGNLVDAITLNQSWINRNFNSPSKFSKIKFQRSVESHDRKRLYHSRTERPISFWSRRAYVRMFPEILTRMSALCPSKGVLHLLLQTNPQLSYPPRSQKVSDLTVGANQSLVIKTYHVVTFIIVFKVVDRRLRR